MNNKLFGMLAGAVVLGVTALVTSAATAIKASFTMKKLNKSFKQVEDLSEDKITEIVIRKAVEKAALEKVTEFMTDTENQVVRSAENSLRSKAHDAVESCAKDIRKQAAEKVAKQVADLDIEKLKKEVRDQAEAHVLEKLDDIIDDSSKQFKDQLEHTQKIYKRLAKAMSEEEEEANKHLYFVL